MKRFSVKVGLLLVVLSLAGCRDEVASGEPLLKLTVDAGGAVVINGTPVSPQQALAAIRDQADTPGVVWYYADETFARPNPVAVNITDALVEAHLQVIRSADPQFSDLGE